MTLSDPETKAAVRLLLLLVLYLFKRTKAVEDLVRARRPGKIRNGLRTSAFLQSMEKKGAGFPAPFYQKLRID